MFQAMGKNLSRGSENGAKKCYDDYGNDNGNGGYVSDYNVDGNDIDNNNIGKSMLKNMQMRNVAVNELTSQQYLFSNDMTAIIRRE